MAFETELTALRDILELVPKARLGQRQSLYISAQAIISLIKAASPEEAGRHANGRLFSYLEDLEKATRRGAGSKLKHHLAEARDDLIVAKTSFRRLDHSKKKRIPASQNNADASTSRCLSKFSAIRDRQNPCLGK